MSSQQSNLVEIIEELTWRNLLKQYTNKTKIVEAQKNHKGVYCGFDPTGDSLHVGHLIQIISLLRFKNAGFQPIAVIGGGTGMIGDPSGKKSERVLLEKNTIISNVQAIAMQLTQLIPEVTVVNNHEWLGELSLLEFLREIGKNFNISYMLSKDSIASRIDAGLSVTEFLYTIIQAYDFLKLYQLYDCHVQIGGSDQWGNITSGIDLINKVIGENALACGITMNLLVKADGTKFGKTETGTIWLDSQKTSVYQFYQFFFNQDDNEAQKLLTFLTFFTKSEIAKMISDHQNNPKAKVCQQALANFLTTFVHGTNQLAIAQRVSNLLFHDDYEHLQLTDMEMLKQNIPFFKNCDYQKNIFDLLIEHQIIASRRIGRDLINQNAIIVNGQLLMDGEIKLTPSFLLFDRYVLIKKGKRNFFLLSW